MEHEDVLNGLDDFGSENQYWLKPRNSDDISLGSLTLQGL